MEEIKTILVDTCIWIDYLKSKEKRDVVSNIVKGATLYTNSLINFELEVGLRSQDEKEFWKIINKNLLALPISKDITDELEKYKTSIKELHYNVTPSATDAVIGAQVLKFKRSNLFLLTANHKDFPIEIFERIETFWFGGEKPGTYCLYRAK